MDRMSDRRFILPRGYASHSTQCVWECFGGSTDEFLTQLSNKITGVRMCIWFKVPLDIDTDSLRARASRATGCEQEAHDTRRQWRHRRLLSLTGRLCRPCTCHPLFPLRTLHFNRRQGPALRIAAWISCPQMSEGSFVEHVATRHTPRLKAWMPFSVSASRGWRDTTTCSIGFLRCGVETCRSRGTPSSVRSPLAGLVLRRGGAFFACSCRGAQGASSP